MIFETRVAGIPCQCEVLSFTPSVPMRVYGPGMGDADAPESAEFEYQLLDRKGYKADWLQAKVTSKIEDELYEEFLDRRLAERYDHEY